MRDKVSKNSRKRNYLNSQYLKQEKQKQGAVH